jgi:hypothetical protein
MRVVMSAVMVVVGTLLVDLIDLVGEVDLTLWVTRMKDDDGDYSD